MLTTRATVACRYYEHAKPRRNIQATRMPRYNDNGSIALPMRCPGVSRDDKSSWKPDRFERAVARKHEAPIFPTASNQTSHVLRSAWFRARFSYSYWSPGASPSSWSPRLDFLRIHLEETINHLVARTVRSSVSIFIWPLEGLFEVDVMCTVNSMCDWTMYPDGGINVSSDRKKQKIRFFSS